MPSYTIGGCQVHFPHQAYGVQLSFMNKVIAALEGGHNALLEAPTGARLAAAALVWRECLQHAALHALQLHYCRAWEYRTC